MVRLLLLFLGLLGLIGPAIAGGYSAPGGGVSLSAANTWTGNQIFSNGTLKLLGASGAYTTTLKKDNNGTQNNEILVPSGGGNDTLITSWSTNTYNGLNVFANQANFSGNAYFFDNKLRLYNSGLTRYLILTAPTQAGDYTLTIPQLAGNDTIGTLATRAARMGTATLSSGTVTVSTALVTANSRIILTGQDNNATGNLRVSARNAGVDFTITSSDGAASGVVAYEIVEP